MAKYIQNLDCSKWMFDNIPEFRKGKMMKEFADVGCGLELDMGSPTEKDSYMHSFLSVEKEDFAEYIKTLESKFEKSFENEIEGNLFYRFVTPEGNFSTVYRPKYKLARLVLDRCKNTDIRQFGYSEYDEINDNTILSQYSLHYSHMIRWYSTDCGMNYIYRLRDNSIIIIDGGEIEQATDKVIKEYWEYLRRLTNTKESEKITISLWICTHAHNDHTDFFAKLIRVYGDKINLERVAFSFTANMNMQHSPSVAIAKQRITALYPDVKYLKIRAGDEFDIANAKITILGVNEDIVAIGDDERTFCWMNDASSVFRIEADGVSAVFLADAGDSYERILLDYYSPDIFRCNFLQIAHHGINYLPYIYAAAKADKVLLPQARLNMITRFQDVIEDLYKNFGEKNIIYAYDVTSTIKLKGGDYSITALPHSGTVYDGSEL